MKNMSRSAKAGFFALRADLPRTPCAAGSLDRHRFDDLRSPRSDGEHCVGLRSQVCYQAASYLVAQCPPPIRMTVARARSSAARVAKTPVSVLFADSPARLPPDVLSSLQCTSGLLCWILGSRKTHAPTKQSRQSSSALDLQFILHSFWTLTDALRRCVLRSDDAGTEALPAGNAIAILTYLCKKAGGFRRCLAGDVNRHGRCVLCCVVTLAFRICARTDPKGKYTYMKICFTQCGAWRGAPGGFRGVKA